MKHLKFNVLLFSNSQILMDCIGFSLTHQLFYQQQTETIMLLFSSFPLSNMLESHERDTTVLIEILSRLVIRIMGISQY